MLYSRGNVLAEKRPCQATRKNTTQPEVKEELTCKTGVV